MAQAIHLIHTGWSMRVPELTPTTTPAAMQRTVGGGGQEGGRHSSLVCAVSHHLTLTDQRPSITRPSAAHSSPATSQRKLEFHFHGDQSHSGLQQEERGTSARVRKNMAIAINILCYNPPQSHSDPPQLPLQPKDPEQFVTPDHIWLWPLHPQYCSELC